MTQDVSRPGSADIEVPANIFVGSNVVRKHLAEFYYRAATQKLLSDGEEVLAVFDCVILESNGHRLGGLTLHDYAILTNQNLITWGRGRTRDMLDKFIWADVALEKFGRRNLLEGVVKVSYRSRPQGSKRKISVRGKEDGSEKEADVIVSDSSAKGLVLYIDLLPLEDVKTCASMMRFLINSGGETPTVAAFKSNFKTELEESTKNLLTAPTLLKSFYKQQANGVYIEDGFDEEEFVVSKLPRRYSAGGTPKLKKGYASPYQLGGSTRARVEPAPRALRPAAAKEEPDTKFVTRSTSVRGKENSLFGTASLDTSPYNGPSKLDGDTVRPAAVVKTTAPARPASVPARPAPVAKVAAEKPAPRPAAEPSGGGAVLDEKQGGIRAERALSMPIVVAIGKEALNFFSISRLARGLWLNPRNFGRNLSDLGDTSALVADIVAVIATDDDSRRMAMHRIQKSVSGGVLANNIVLHYTVWPFLKPILDLVTSRNEGEPSIRTRLKIRNTEPSVVAALPPLSDKVASDAPKTPDAKPVKVNGNGNKPTETVAQVAPAKPAPVTPPPAPAKPANVAPAPAPAPAKVETPAPPSKLDNLTPATPAKVENVTPAPAAPAKPAPAPAAPAKVENVTPAPAAPAKTESAPTPPSKLEHLMPTPAAPAKPENVTPAPAAPAKPENTTSAPAAPAKPENATPPSGATTKIGNVTPPPPAPAKPENATPPAGATTKIGNVTPPPAAPVKPENATPPAGATIKVPNVTPLPTTPAKPENTTTPPPAPEKKETNTPPSSGKSDK